MANRQVPLFTLALLIGGAQLAQAADFYVDPSMGNNSNSGASWALAKSTLQAAVAAAAPGDTLHLRTGSYAVNGSAGPIAINKTLTILGGYSYCGLRRPRTAPSSLYNIGPQVGSNPPTITKSGTGTLKIDGLRFYNGYTNTGGGIDGSGGTLDLENCWFVNNVALATGGAVRFQGGTINAKLCRFTNGLAGFFGGAMALDTVTASIVSNFFETNKANSVGGAMHLALTTGNISSNTYYDSISPAAPVLQFMSGNIQFKNNVVRKTSGSAAAALVASQFTPIVSLSNNLFWNLSGTRYSWTTGGTNDLIADPLQYPDNFHLMAGSPCINAGDSTALTSTTDYDLETRVFGSSIDRGGDEVAPRDIMMLWEGCLEVIGVLSGNTSGTLMVIGSGGTVQAYPILTDEHGHFSFEGPALDYGVYRASFKGANTLRKAVDVEISGEGAVFSFALVPGDIDDDNAVTVFDYSLLSDAFDSAPGTANWNPLADLDGDGAVSVFDYALLSDNFDKVGDDQ